MCVIIPASIELYLQHQYNQYPQLHATLEQRMVMNNGWDQDRNSSFKAFLNQYPQYKNYQLPESGGSWQWYYAKQHMSDEAVKDYWQQYITQQQQKYQTLNNLSLLSPSLMMQLAVNKLAGSSGQQQFAYQMQVADYHQQIREYLYPHLFSDKQPSSEIVANYPQFQPQTNKEQLSFLTLFLLLLMLGFGWYGLIIKGKPLPQV